MPMCHWLTASEETDGKSMHAWCLLEQTDVFSSASVYTQLGCAVRPTGPCRWLAPIAVPPVQAVTAEAACSCSEAMLKSTHATVAW